MKLLLAIAALAIFNSCYGQTVEKIKIPQGVNYKYCDVQTIEKAKKLIAADLSDSTKFSLSQDMLIVGPQLWTRFREIKRLNEIEGGNTIFHVDDKELSGKMTQDVNDTKKVWDEFRKEIKGNYTIRKANERELTYYWSVISFDIEEPLLIVETKEHNYILNILKKDLKLMWLDEAPGRNGVKIYQNGNEINAVPKGTKETKLEKLVLLSRDEELKKNTSVEDISTIVEKTSRIFEDLFKSSTGEGKIMIHFELNKNENKIEFAVKDDIDLEIMKVFEKRINAEVYPHSKKDPVRFQIIYKVNSYNDTE